jgi:hypothetical protein
VTNINLNINRAILDQDEQLNADNISKFIEEVLDIFEDNPKYYIKRIKLSFYHNDDFIFIFILEEQDTIIESLPYILEDMAIICRIRKIKFSNISRAFIKVTLGIKS